MMPDAYVDTTTLLVLGFLVGLLAASEFGDRTYFRLLVTPVFVSATELASRNYFQAQHVLRGDGWWFTFTAICLAVFGVGVLFAGAAYVAGQAIKRHWSRRTTLA